jgi:FAD synthase
MAPQERSIPFADVRDLSPEEFVTVLANDLGAKGVVVGSNYRFGYKAAGTADTLKRLGKQHGMKVEIVNLVEKDALGITAHGLGDIVSSSLIRDALKSGKMGSVEECTERTYRLVASGCRTDSRGGTWRIENGAFLNQYPSAGEYSVCFGTTSDPAGDNIAMTQGKAVFDQAGATIVVEGQGGQLGRRPSTCDTGACFCILEFIDK